MISATLSDRCRDVTRIEPAFSRHDLQRFFRSRALLGLVGLGWVVSACAADASLVGACTDRPLSLNATSIGVALSGGRDAGLRHVYAGNLPGRVGDLEDTRCATCGEPLVARYGYHIRNYHLTADGRCPSCAAAVRSYRTCRNSACRNA